MTQPGRGKSDLLAAARDAVAAEAEKREAERLRSASATSRRVPAWLVPLLGVLSVAAVIILLVRPEWLIGSRRPPPEPPAVVTANARGALVVVAARLQAYKNANGRLPMSLAQLIDVDTTGLVYRRITDDRYELRTAQAPIVTISSEDDPYTMLKNQVETLRRRPQ